MTFWAVAQLESAHVPYALYCLRQLGYAVYAPRRRISYVVRGRKIERLGLLFPSYVFVTIESQWHAARHAPGVIRLVMDGEGPAHVPAVIIAALKSREIRGAIELVKPVGLQHGDEVRIARSRLKAGRLFSPAV